MTDQPDSSAPKPFDERIEESDKEEIEYSEPSDRPMRAVFPVIEGDEEKQIPATDDFITPERIQALHERASHALDRIKEEINKVELAGQLFDKIERSRQLLFEGKDNYEESERLIVDVEHRLDFIRRVKQSSRTVGMRLFIYELIIFITLIAIFVLINTEPQASLINQASPFASVNLVQFINTLLWGGFGGVVGAFYALWKHIAAEQDFDPQYALWYITNPLLGIALGAFVFLVFQAGFFSLTAGTEENVSIRSALVIYVFAWVSGFKQNVVYEIVRRILDVFRVELGGKSGESQTMGVVEEERK
ncbi:hypothetical protein BECAL_02395 [Bellilinea caldifistulae]|uniref:Uncharacterized protein n=1 Tax=Bellilinea caldifistulae TaxID=360411 RepID=A0A0P6WZC0_9CHLR|nr:hypothetical protein [Bellilinea caldifistulae]KPL73916.1 hypothetical protein AC812_14150 [Bellilinea caldifistulae]GAP11209.1 hypothetical protein BECAL_02395 [Bellilinea caldifistulae]